MRACSVSALRGRTRVRTIALPRVTEPPWKCWRGLIQHRRIQKMSAPRKKAQESRRRAVRRYRERLAEPGESKRAARRHVGLLLDLNPETLRNWAEERDRVESGRSSAPRSAESGEVRALRRRVAELERANEILKTSAAFSPRRSSTADFDDRGLHRLPSRVLRQIGR